MRAAILAAAALLLLLGGCKSQKNSQTSQSVCTDSLALSVHHRSMAVLDSLSRNLDFSFDTLKIKIERPSSVGDAPEVIRLTAICGRVVDRQRAHRNQVEVYNSLDTVHYKQSAVETSTQHAATTRLGSPPSATLLIALALVIGALLLWLKLR